MRTIRFLAVLIVAGLLALWPGAALAGGGGGGGGPCAGYAVGGTLVMRDNCFDGVAHFADAGGTLVVRNDGQLPHSFTAVDGSFDTGVLDPGKSAKIKLGKAGIVRAYCSLHGSMQGGGMAGVLVVGQPTPASVGAAAQTESLQTALAEHDRALLGAVEAQSESLAEMEAEIAALQQAVQQESGRSFGINWMWTTVPAVLGLVLGGAALTLVVRQRRQAVASSA